MKGLVFKDLLLMKKMNKKVILVMYFFVIAISFFGENEVYSIMSSAFFSEYSCAMKSHFRKFGNQMSGSGNHLCNYASLLA